MQCALPCLLLCPVDIPWHALQAQHGSAGTTELVCVIVVDLVIELLGLVYWGGGTYGVYFNRRLSKAGYVPSNISTNARLIRGDSMEPDTNEKTFFPSDLSMLT